MTAMLSTVPRVRDGVKLSAVGCTLVIAAALVGGCARLVTGTARPGELQIRPSAPIPVADLLIDPAKFPRRFPAALVNPKEIDHILGEIDGVPTGSDVTPPECAPLPVLTLQKAAVRGSADDGDASLVVMVIRPVPSLHARVSQLAECTSFTVVPAGEGAETSTVTVHLRPPPPVDADDSYAVDQTVTSESADVPDTRTLTLVALIRDVEVTASWQQTGSATAEPDTQALDTLFTDAVLNVRRQLPG